MTDYHPITPPPELVREWTQNRGYSCADELWDYLAAQAAQWGADAELEACLEWIANQDWTWTKAQLHDARRPKPPSLNSIALQMLGTIEQSEHFIPEITDTIRRALEALPND